MNDINEMPPKCQYCPYWEICEYPWVCPDKEQLATKLQQTCHANDNISRQAAIEAVHKNYDTILDFKTDGKTISSSIEDILSNLPPAQSEQRWIPYNERLPEKNCRCLTTNTAWGAFEVDWNVWINGEWLYQNEKPIAWMPMPEPYKEDDHD